VVDLPIDLLAEIITVARIRLLAALGMRLLRWGDAFSLDTADAAAADEEGRV
jgi:hypothetical protein